MSIIAYQCRYAYGSHLRSGFHLIDDNRDSDRLLAVLPAESTDDELRAVAKIYGYTSVVIDRLP